MHPLKCAYLTYFVMSASLGFLTSKPYASLVVKMPMYNTRLSANGYSQRYFKLIQSDIFISLIYTKKTGLVMINNYNKLELFRFDVTSRLVEPTVRNLPI